MTSDLSLMLDGLPADSPADRYRQAIIDENLLGKATRSTRLKAARHLTNLYALDPSKTVFRLLRHVLGSGSTRQADARVSRRLGAGCPAEGVL